MLEPYVVKVTSTVLRGESGGNIADLPDKSQGSEYPVVIIPILNEAHIMLKRNLIYTAITRAKEKVIIVGQKEAFFGAIHKMDDSKRNSVLGKLIAG
jgi:exodeoxyribonuclease V alpha subunit